MKKTAAVLASVLVVVLAGAGTFMLTFPGFEWKTIALQRMHEFPGHPSAFQKSNAEPTHLPRPAEPARQAFVETVPPPSASSPNQQAPIVQNAISRSLAATAGRPPEAGRSVSTSTPARRPSQPAANGVAIANAAILSSGTASSGVMTRVGSQVPQAASGTVLEIDPGVPLPAAMMAPDVAEPAPVAAAREQVADSFVNNVESASNSAGAASSPSSAGTAADSDASGAYFQSLNQANETYRALYGDEAFNRQSMRAMIEANSAD